VPKVTAAASAPAIAPRAGVSLATLGSVYALSKPDAKLEIGVAQPAALGRALAWRLSRRPGAERFELQAVALTDQPCVAADVQREQEVIDAREGMLRQRATTDAAQKQATQAQDTYDLRRKWKATWKAIAKANETRVKALATLAQEQQRLSEAEKSYEAVAKHAESFDAAAPQADDAKARSLECTVAVASLRELPSGKQLELHLPASMERRMVTARLNGADFAVTRAAGLWSELENKTPKEALAALRARFSWHYRYVEVGGMKLGGMTILQLAPLGLLPMFLGLLRRSRGVGAIYNPFDRPSVESLPTVGLGVGALNLLVLVVLPLAACALCVFSLVQIHQVPIVPGLCVLATAGLGSASHFALKELLDLRDAITRSHSNPPAAPAR
jgi:hypothetical protein